MSAFRTISRIRAALTPARVARSLITVLTMALLQTVAIPVVNIGLQQSSAATLSDNLSQFVQWNTWQRGNNHVPYEWEGTNQVTSNTQEIKLTTDAAGQTGFLWNKNEVSGDFSVSAAYFFGSKDVDGADGISFLMMPLTAWPNGGTLGASGSTYSGMSNNSIRLMFDTYQNGTEVNADHLKVWSRNNAGTETTYSGTGTSLKNSSGTVITNVEDGAWRVFTIKWDSVTKVISVFSGDLNGAQYSIGTYTITGQTASAYAWGWLGETGGASNNQSIREVNYNYPPVITSNPTNQVTTPGSQVTFSATHTSVDSGVSLQWSSSTDGTTWTNISGATSSSYTITASRDLTQRRYRLGVTNTAANQQYTTYSNSALLTVNPPPLGFETDTALLFNGTSQFAQVADSNEVEFPAAFSVSAWIYPTGAMGDYMILAKNNSIQFYIQNGIYGFSAMADAAWNRVPTGVLALVNQWQHVAYTRLANETDFRFYLNGTLAYTGDADTLISNGAPVNNTSPLTIGGRSTTNGSATSLFAGQIDHLSVFGVARAGEDIRTEMNTYTPPDTANLLLSYDFNEGSGLNLFNRRNVGPSNTDLTLYGSPTFSDVKIASTYGPYSVLQFPRSYITSAGGWKVPSSVTRINYLVVAGGGAGGGSMTEPDYAGGGGGGGGVRTSTAALSPSFLSVTVGVGQHAFRCVSGRGGSSSISGSGLTQVSATGGGSGSCNTSTTDGGSGIAGNSGGSGGGGGSQTYLAAFGAGNLGGYSPAEGFNGGAARADGSDGRYQSGGGGGGATELGGNGSASLAGKGGAGLLSTILDGTNRYYGGGGGGGVRFSITAGAAAVGQGGIGGGGNGGSGGSVQGVAGTYGLGGGGGGNSKPNGNSGGSGVVIIRWITALKPVFNQPSNDTTTAGIVDTITVSANPISPLVRSYLWQSSSDTDTSWSNISTGSGFLTNTYTTPILETTTSGSRYQYRVIVTDSDTSGLSIVDTSVAVFIVINPRITFSGTFTPQKYGELESDTFTVTNGTGNKTFSYSPGNRPGITWSSPTANTAVVTVARTVSVGTYIETITATDTRGAITRLAVSVVVSKADTITVTALARSDTYTGSALNFTPSFSVLGLKNSDTATPVTYTYAGADNAGTAYGSSSTKPMNAGRYAITPVTPSSLLDSYTAVMIETGTLTINRAVRAITVTPPAFPMKYGETKTVTSTLSAGAGDGTISYATSTTDSCTVSSATIRAIKASGACLFTATISRGNNFETATSTSESTTLARADTLTVQLRNPVTMVYNGEAPTSLPVVTIVGLSHTDTTTATRLYSAPASMAGASESYPALVNSAAVPIDVESYTVSTSLDFSSGSLSNYVNVVYETSTIKITKASQPKLSINLYGAVAGSPFTILTAGGAGPGTVAETVTAGGTALNCAISNRVLSNTSSSSEQKTCNVIITKGASRNYFSETLTATIYFMTFSSGQPTQLGGGSAIGLSGATSLTIDLTAPPSISSFSTNTLSLSSPGNFTINGGGFGTSSIIVKFWRNKEISVTSSNGTTLVIPISSISAAGATTGRILVVAPNGSATSLESLTITP